MRPASQAARDVDELAGRYAEALAAVSDALDVDADALPTIAVYLADLPSDDPRITTDPANATAPKEPVASTELTIWTAYGAEAPMVGAEIEVARALLTYGYGAGQPEVRFWDEGFAGHIAALSGRSAYHAEALTHCRDLLRDGALPPLAELVAESAERVSALASTASAAFASYLIERYGMPRYQMILKAARAGDPDPFGDTYSMALAIADRDWRRHLEASSGKEQPGLWATLLRLMPIARPYWRSGLAVLACSLVGIAFSLALPLSFRFLIDSILARRPLSQSIPLVGPAGHVIQPGQEQVDVLFLLFGVLGLLYVANAAARLGMNLLIAAVGEAFSFDLRRRLVSILERLPTSYYARRTPADISQGVIYDVETVQQVVTRAAIPMLSGAVAILCFAALLIALEPKLALVTLGGLPLVALIHGARRRGRRAAARGGARTRPPDDRSRRRRQRGGQRPRAREAVPGRIVPRRPAAPAHGCSPRAQQCVCA